VSTVAAPVVLADLVPRLHVRRAALLRTSALVLGAALFTAACAQIRINLSFTPVPITGQTFAVLLAGAALGWRAGAASQGLYWVLGAIGLPFYANHEGGWASATGSTFGYFIGFVLAAAMVGYLAERKQDRSFATSVPAMLMGTAIIYAAGVLWLAHDLHIPVYSATDSKNAINFGLTPFIIGDTVKVLLAGALTPLAWHFARSARSR